MTTHHVCLSGELACSGCNKCPACLDLWDREVLAQAMQKTTQTVIQARGMDGSISVRELDAQNFWAVFFGHYKEAIRTLHVNMMNDPQIAQHYAFDLSRIPAWVFASEPEPLRAFVPPAQPQAAPAYPPQAAPYQPQAALYQPQAAPVYPPQAAPYQASAAPHQAPAVPAPQVAAAATAARPVVVTRRTPVATVAGSAAPLPAPQVAPTSDAAPEPSPVGPLVAAAVSGRQLTIDDIAAGASPVPGGEAVEPTMLNGVATV